MTNAQRGAARVGIILAGVSVVLGFLLEGRRPAFQARRRGPRPAPRRNPSPAPVAELAELSPREARALRRQLRQVAKQGETCARRVGRAPRTFRTTRDAVAALVDANPQLLAFLEGECSHDCKAFREWYRGGRRGQKPRATPGDGRFDAINERLERRTPGRKVASWLEAVYVVQPPARNLGRGRGPRLWEDVPPRLEVLEEASGLRLELPEPAARLERIAADRDRCAEAAELEAAELLAAAREVQIVPF